MGLSCNIICDRDILEDDIEDILKNMPDGLGWCMGTVNKQSWGWVAKVDVYLPTNNTMRLSGSYSCSGKYIDVFRKNFRNLLKKKGYKVRTTMDY